MTMRPLREHQSAAMAMLRKSLGEGHQAPMLQAPTGAGKTRIAAEIVSGALSKKKRVLFVVPALSLIDQTVAALETEGIWDIGVMQGIHERTDSCANVQVASVQTLQRRKMPGCDVIVIDEAHRWFKFFETMIRDAKAKRVPVIGLSATPWAKGLGRFYDDLLPVISTQELIDRGFLSPFRVFAPDHPNLDGVRTVAGDYHEGDLSKAMDRPELVADVVATWLRQGEGRPTLCFAVDRAHAANLRKQFAESGVPTGYIDAFTTREERAKIRHQFHSGEIKVCCNVGCLTTGVDWDVRCIILARPTKSEMLFVQIIGRGLRTAEGKENCLILDHSNTHEKLGFVTDISFDKLDTGRKAEAEERKPVAKPRECKSCGFLRPAKVLSCPACGFTPEPRSDVAFEDGELVELGAAAADKTRVDRAFKVQFYSELVGYAEAYGKSDKWVLANYRTKFNEWPRAMRPQGAPPSPALIRWVKSRQIAFAKSRKAA